VVVVTMRESALKPHRHTPISQAVPGRHRRPDGFTNR